MNLEFLKHFFNKRAVCFSGVYAFLFSILFVFGRVIDTSGTVAALQIKNFYLWGIVFSVVFVLFALFLNFLPQIISRVNSIKCLPKLNDIFFKPTFKSFLYCFLLILIAHIPCFLAYFPGIFNYDIYYQWQFFWEPEHIENHPILHSLMIYGIYWIYKITGINFLGLILYTVFQVIIMNLIFAYAVRFVAKITSSDLVKMFALLFFALYPTNAIFPLIATKDVLFSGFVLLFVILFAEFFIDTKEFFKRPKKIIGLISAIMLVALFRHNGFYAYLLVLPFFIWYLYKTNIEFFKKSLIVLLIPVFLFSIFSVVKKSFGIQSFRASSVFAMSLQQMARVRLYKSDVLSSEDKSMFKSFIKNDLAYNPYCVDDIKEDDTRRKYQQHCSYFQNALESRPKDFFRLYFKWLKEYPVEYIDAYMFQTYHSWYPLSSNKKLTMLSHRPSNTYLLTESLLLPMLDMARPDNSYNLWLKYFFDWLYNDFGFEENPITFFIFSVAINTWIFFAGLFILTYRRKYYFLLPLLLNLILFVTILYAPAILFRYLAQNFLVIPLLLAFCLHKEEERIKV